MQPHNYKATVSSERHSVAFGSSLRKTGGRWSAGRDSPRNHRENWNRARRLPAAGRVVPGGG